MKTNAAKRHFQTQRALAEAAEISEAAVSQWGEYVPESRARILAAKTTLKYDAGLYRRIDEKRRNRVRENRIAASRS